MINTATSITSDIIGQSGETSSFVTSFYLSLFKLLDGILTFSLLEYITGFTTAQGIINSMVFVPCGCGVAALLLNFLGRKMYVKRMLVLLKEHRVDAETQQIILNNY
mmetsp:Transcript_35564/g.26427  ORF Transcript_35564/g.26427 Transcript_35564/m.26427 type:complete len:107 (+) Transcript_35564:893-1213(+)